MTRIRDKECLALLLLGAALISTASLAAEHTVVEEVLIIEDELIIEEEAPSAVGNGLIIEEATPGEDSLIIEEAPAAVGNELIIEEESPAAENGLIIEGETPTTAARPAAESSLWTLGLDELWTEYGYFPDANAFADSQAYLHGQATALWRPSGQWDLQASVRLDAYAQQGGRDWTHATLDYGETFIQYRSDNYRLTAGAQKVLWGRIDEFPPTDRMSTHDLSRYILDDLADRRRAAPAIRFEHFTGNRKLDLVYLPYFREAELPGVDSVWFPVNQRSGEIFGLQSTPATVALIQNSPVDSEGPDSDGGFGMRYSSTDAGLDYAVTVQRVRQSVPYFAYNPSRGVLEARYPRSWLVGGDLGVEALGAIWRVEGAWLSDVPVTRLNGAFDKVESINWGVGVEFFPGDGDARVNLQLTGINHLNAPSVLDRTEIYLLGGSLEVPFAQNRWRLKGRFYKGLDTHDLYLNPEIAYTGWDSQEVYLDAHYFEGAAGTPGGFHQDNSVISVGWRVKF